MTSQYLTIDEAAAHIGVRTSMLRTWMNKGTGPKFLKLSPQTPPKFRTADLDAWMETKWTETSAKKPSPAKKTGNRKQKVVAGQELLG